MPNMSLQKNIGGYVKAFAGGASENSGAASLITAAGTGDNAEVTGQTIDRDGYDSAVVSIAYLATLADTESISFAVDIQESSDGSSWDTAEELQAATTAVTSSGGTNEHGVVELDVNLSGRKQYVRFNVTPNLSAGATDTALFATTVILGGASTLPAS